MRRALLLHSVVPLAIAVAAVSAQSPVAAPITEWPALALISDMSGLAIDKHGAVWTSGHGKFSVERGGPLIFSVALTRLVPQTNSLSYWLLGQNITVAGLKAAPDGTMFFAVGTKVLRFEPATNCVAPVDHPECGDGETDRRVRHHRRGARHLDSGRALGVGSAGVQPGKSVS